MTFQDLKRALAITGGIIMIAFLILVMVLMVISMIDISTLEKIGSKRVKCIDDVGAEFEDEWCEKNIYCSSLGIAGSKRCGK